MSVEMGTRIIKVIEDVDFCFLGDWDMTDENLIMKFDPKHGTVIYVAGIIDGDPNSLMSLGAEEGSTDFKVAFYAPFKEFNKMWDELMKL